MTHHPSASGFTLIELLIAMAIIVMVVGGVIANYDRYNSSQRLRQASLSLKNDFRLAQNQAVSGQKPTSGCSQLIGYQVTFEPTSYWLQAVCLEGLVGELTTIRLPLGISFSPVPAPIIFGVLTQGVDNDVTITLIGSSKKYAIGVSKSGDINDLGFQ